MTKARLLAVCSVLCPVIEVNGVQCFTSSSLSFSSEQLSSKEKKMNWLNPVPLASFNTGAVEDVCDVVLDRRWHSQWQVNCWACCVLV